MPDRVVRYLSKLCEDEKSDLKFVMTKLSFYSTSGKGDYTDYGLEDNGECLEELVLKILGYAEDHASVNCNTGVIETLEERSRSALDIWRHIKYIRTEVTLLDVLKAIYNLFLDYENNFGKNPPVYSTFLVGHYCYNVRRQVYKARSPKIQDWRLHYNLHADEFGFKSIEEYKFLFEEK